MACPNESNKEKKREEKVKKYQQLCYEIRERRDGYKVKIIPVVIGCLGGGMKRLKDGVEDCSKMRKNCNGYVEKCKRLCCGKARQL